MFRVVTKHVDHRRKLIAEAGPWHPSRENAENWAQMLQYLGYDARVESQLGMVPAAPDGDLRNALASMA